MAARFTSAKPLPFGLPSTRADDADSPDIDTSDLDEVEGLPAPKQIRLKQRKAAGIAEAKAIIDLIPAPGESTHCVCTSRMDLTDVLSAMLERLGRCERMFIATLGFNVKNVMALLEWIDEEAVGSLSLMTSKYFVAHKRAIWDITTRELRKRNQRAAAAYSHCKVVTLAMADGAKYVIEGSANLSGNGSGREQFALIHHAELHDWHAAWIDQMVSRNEGRETKTGQAENKE